MNQSARRAQAVVALTEGDAAEWRKVNKSVYVIPDVVRIRREEVRRGGGENAVFVGRLSRQKDIGSLLVIWQMVRQRHPDWQLHVYGEKGDVEETLWQKLQEEGNGVTAHPPTADIMDVYQHHVMLLLTSRYEPFGMVLPEAMSCGLPVVAFDCPYGPADIITDGVDGFLIKDCDTQKFVDKVCLLIENEELRRKMGQMGIKASERYQKDTIMPLWKNMFKKMLDSYV